VFQTAIRAETQHDHRGCGPFRPSCGDRHGNFGWDAGVGISIHPAVAVVVFSYLGCVPDHSCCPCGVGRFPAGILRDPGGRSLIGAGMGRAAAATLRPRARSGYHDRRLLTVACCDRLSARPGRSPSWATRIARANASSNVNGWGTSYVIAGIFPVCKILHLRAERSACPAIRCVVIVTRTGEQHAGPLEIVVHCVTHRL
jgi:hypothetical protein